ncbi:ABC transporter substrate-binding protein [Pelagibius sp. Alg239-R121]|uniref:taurine ABC transporter substrate-binding protein n=1 Tax=Pelagibius sp. Alg239-R121 TaxID=2993448 RepID=UPI0024A6908D|nr:ABC transporter substrate-binding protein [Pelagibius sp. Alg239-R121]
MKSFFATVLVAGSVMGAAVSSAFAASHEKVTIAYFKEWPTANQVAQAEKWYDEAMGVEVEWRAFNTGVEMAEAMVAGDVQISFSMGIVPFALAVTDGAPIKVVGMAVDTGGADNCVIYKKEAIDRANAHELEGRKVAVPLNTVTHYKMLRSLVFLGVDIGKLDVVDMSPHDIDDAFIGGELAMGCSWGGPLRRMKGHGWELLSANEQDRLGIRAFDVIAVTNDYASEHPDQVVKFLEVTDRAIKHLDDDPKAAEAVIAEAAGLELKDSNIVLSLFDFYTREDQLTERWMKGGIQTFIKEVADFFEQQGKIGKALDDYAPTVDASFYEKAQ